MTGIAHELSRRASPRYIGDQAKETAMHKANEWTEQIGRSPVALGLIGGTIGALLGRALANERRSRSYGWNEPSWDIGRPGADAGIGEKIAGTAHDLKDKAGDMVANVRERMPSVSDVGHQADENPLLVALGGLALGAVAALLLPVSRKERELLDPVKQRAGEAIGSLGDKIGDGVQQAREKIVGSPARAPSDGAQAGVPALTH